MRVWFGYMSDALKTFLGSQRIMLKVLHGFYITTTKE